MSEGQEFWVRCKTCGHEWVAAYLPMPVEAFVKIGQKCICPKCAEHKDVICGRASDAS